jgi:hypothetical protein
VANFSHYIEIKEKNISMGPSGKWSTFCFESVTVREMLYGSGASDQAG